jgi:hypothetical protein
LPESRETASSAASTCAPPLLEGVSGRGAAPTAGAEEVEIRWRRDEEDDTMRSLGAGFGQDIELADSRLGAIAAAASCGRYRDGRLL